jgi:hypothetical protein
LREHGLRPRGCGDADVRGGFEGGTNGSALYDLTEATIHPVTMYWAAEYGPRGDKRWAILGSNQ